MSDAFHLLSDVASFIVALAAIYLAEKPATKSKFEFFDKQEDEILIPPPLKYNRTFIWLSSCRSDCCPCFRFNNLGSHRFLGS